ncbi:DinB family protein [Metabacillus sp. RGM 3146]|uniref:DinB family protein n=1 Tax=Metabacillus sp. RGM 3146 TaxID=3401092 RepID=UPI003B9C6393
MNPFDLLTRELRNTYENEDWYAPLKPALEGLSAEQANWKPDGESCNTIWETVSHLLYYKERLLLHLKGEDHSNPVNSNEATFSVFAGDDENAWKETISRLEKVQQELMEFVSLKNEEDFDTIIAQKYPAGNYISSIIMHDAYHTGQIVLLRKLQGSWPSAR